MSFKQSVPYGNLKLVLFISLLWCHVIKPSLFYVTGMVLCGKIGKFKLLLLSIDGTSQVFSLKFNTNILNLQFYCGLN